MRLAVNSSVYKWLGLSRFFRSTTTAKVRFLLYLQHTKTKMNEAPRRRSRGTFALMRKMKFRMDARWILVGGALMAVAAGTPASHADERETVAAVEPVAAPAPVTLVTKRDERAALIASAVDSISPHVRKLSHDDALRMAITAYFNFKAAHPEQVQKPYLYFVDYGLDNRTARGYVFDMESLTLVEGPFLVAHGRGSLAKQDGVPTRFTNGHGSATTSLGLYVAAETYGFSGHASGQLYHSIGLRLDGKSGEFNSAARSRGVVAHGAPYVTRTRAGRSEGCPAMDQARARRLIPMIANGGIVFLYSPNHEQWLRNDPWVNAPSSNDIAA